MTSFVRPENRVRLCIECPPETSDVIEIVHEGCAVCRACGLTQEMGMPSYHAPYKDSENGTSSQVQVETDTSVIPSFSLVVSGKRFNRKSARQQIMSRSVENIPTPMLRSLGRAHMKKTHKNILARRTCKTEAQQEPTAEPTQSVRTRGHSWNDPNRQKRFRRLQRQMNTCRFTDMLHRGRPFISLWSRALSLSPRMTASANAIWESTCRRIFFIDERRRVDEFQKQRDAEAQQRHKKQLASTGRKKQASGNNDEEEEVTSKEQIIKNLTYYAASAIYFAGLHHGWVISHKEMEDIQRQPNTKGHKEFTISAKRLFKVSNRMLRLSGIKNVSATRVLEGLTARACHRLGLDRDWTYRVSRSVSRFSQIPRLNSHTPSAIAAAIIYETCKHRDEGKGRIRQEDIATVLYVDRTTLSKACKCILTVMPARMFRLDGSPFVKKKTTTKKRKHEVLLSTESPKSKRRFRIVKTTTTRTRKITTLFALIQGKKDNEHE